MNCRKLCLSFLVPLFLHACSCGLGAESLRMAMGESLLEMDARGRVISLRGPDGREHAAANAPSAFEVETAEGVFPPSEVTRMGNELHIGFGERGSLRLEIQEERGFVLLRLRELAWKGNAVERLQWFCLPVRGLGTLGSVMNGCYDDRFATALMGTEVPVRARSIPPSAAGVDQQGCSHRFTPAGTEARQGRVCARFEATSRRPDQAGWSMAGRGFAMPQDLRGLRALRAWIHGDGSGQMLKIQLNDASGGYRDDYVKIDFTGWRQVTMDKPALNTIALERVERLNFYYNGLPAGRSVICLLDQVEALTGEGTAERTVLLEDFEDPGSPLWSFEGTRLYAETVRRHGIEPAGVGVIACPRAEFEDTIARFEAAAGLPSPRLEGHWGKASPAAKRSYLFITRFGEADAEEVIGFARRGGFDAILIGQESWCASTGHYPVNRQGFPGGLASLRSTVGKLQQAGFKVGLHYLAPSIYPPDTYLTPVPDPRLVRDAFAELAAPVDAGADFVPTRAVPADFPAEDGGYRGQGSIIQIGEELLQYAERSLEPPYGFRGCRRGVLGTRAAAHGAGERVGHLLKSYGYFLFDMDTGLLDEVAGHLAEVVNATGVDMIYWDGSERLQGDHWYYNAKLHQAFYRRFAKKDLLIQGSSYSHYSWHIVSRQASADGHGDLKGYLDERTPGFRWYRANLMPLDIGWYYVYDTKTTTDQFEYVLNKSLGFDASISLQTSPRHIREHPYIGEIVDLVGAYERLRLSGQVPESTRARLREPRKDYRLVRGEGGEALQRVIYEPFHDIQSLDGEANGWSVEVPGGGALAGVQVLVPGGQWLEAGPSYRAAGSVLLEDFEDVTAYRGGTLAGVTQRFEGASQGGKEGRTHAVYTAESALAGNDGWSYVSRSFPQPLDLSGHKGIGLWLRGDGGGGKFKLQMRDGKDAVDFYLDNDFAGWRYHQLARPARDAIDYARVSQLLLYYNALPGKTKISCAIDDVRALPALDDAFVAQPRFEVAGQSLSWPLRLGVGGSLTAWPGDKPRLTGMASREDGAAVELPPLPAVTLPPGRHEVRFTAAPPLVQAVSVRLLLVTPERLPLQPGKGEAP